MKTAYWITVGVAAATAVTAFVILMLLPVAAPTLGEPVASPFASPPAALPETPAPVAASPATTPLPRIPQSPSPLSSVPARVSLTAPFVPQAPFGQWHRPIFQDGCEEASLLTAWHYVQGTSITEAQTQAAIEDMSVFQDATYGVAVDRSAQDTAQLMRDYFKYDNVRVQYDISAEDIKRELARGNIVITPMNGQALGNPHYTAPGPERHMLAVIGYDDSTNEFITNDPGTQFGQGFRYSQPVFMAAVRDYATGNHLPIPAVRRAMVVVEKE